MNEKPVNSGYCLEIKNVSKSFGSHEVLKGISLTANPGEFIAIVGRSGCGKSTLLRQIAGLGGQSSGDILINGRPAQEDGSLVRFMFQEARLLPWKKIWQNVALFASDPGRENALKYLRSVGLQDRADDWPGSLSGGMKQRLSLARALASEPKILLLDEPLGALDALTRISMQVLIENLWKEKGLTVILVTHDVSEAVYLADRVILLEEGHITMDYPIELARPRERDASFAAFEQHIYRRILKYPDAPRIEYSI